jgi:hypothetical protein
LNARPRAKAFAPSGELLIKGVDLGLEVVLILGRADPAGSSNSRTVLSGFREYPPINLLSHGIVWINLSDVRAQRGHSVIEFRVGQARQEGVSAKGGLSYEFRPVRGHTFRDDRVVLGDEASSSDFGAPAERGMLAALAWLQQRWLERLNARPEGPRPCTSVSAGAQPPHSVPLAANLPKAGNHETVKPGDQVSAAARARTQSHAFASRFDAMRRRPWLIEDGTGNRALRSGPRGRLAGRASGPTPGLLASVSDKALALLELAKLPVRETCAPILRLSQRG